MEGHEERGKMSHTIDLLDTHYLYEIYIDRRSGVIGGRGDFWGDPQVHILNYNTTRLPRDVMARNPPSGRERVGDIVHWYYHPNTSMDMVLTFFRLAGYEIIEVREGAPDRITGHRYPVYIVGKKKK